MSPTIAEVHATLTAPGQPFEMEEVVIRGIPTRTWKHAPPNLRDNVLLASRAQGDRVFLVYEDETLTFEQHFRAAAHLATILRDRFGVQPGDRVAIVMRNYPEWSVAFWAATSAGAVVRSPNVWWTGPELEYGLADSGSVVAFVDAERAQPCGRAHGGALPDLRAVIVAKPDEGEGPLGRWRAAVRRGPRRRARRRRAAGRRARARGRRHDLLHVGHDRPVEGRARHPPQHLHEPHEPRLRPGPRLGPTTRSNRPTPAPAPATRTPTCERPVLPRHRLPLGARGQLCSSAGRS